METDTNKSINERASRIPENACPGVDRRKSNCGRREPMPFWKVFSFRPRRRKSRGRRKTDPGAYVDIYDVRSYCIVFAVLTLSLLDALLTHFHLKRGIAEEANPILRAIIESVGYPSFYSAKIAMTTLPIVVILIHKEWALGKHAARFSLWAYIILSLWHIFILLQ